jgi:ribosomal-protein-alanine N-acetyltransferase
VLDPIGHNRFLSHRHLLSLASRAAIFLSNRNGKACAPSRRLCVEYFTLDDADFILELLNEPDFIRYIADKGVRDMAGAQAYLRDGPLSSYTKHGHGLCKVTLTRTGEPIGMCGLIRRDVFEAPDLGYAFLKRHHRQGYAYEAGAAVLDRARRQMNMGRIVAITAPDNAASIWVLEKLGLQYESELQLPDYSAPSRYFVCDP